MNRLIINPLLQDLGMPQTMLKLTCDDYRKKDVFCSNDFAQAFEGFDV